MGSDPNLTELKTGIVAEGRERDAYATLVEFFKHADRRWEILTIPAVPSGAEDPLCIPHPTQPVIEGFIIPLAADWDAFRSGLKRNVKEAVRKCYNSLKRDGIEPAFTCLSNSASIQDMLPEFYRLHAERGKQQDGVSHPDYFQLDKARTLISLLANDPAESGIRLFILRDGNRLIAARLAFETPRGIYLYYSGFDPEYGKYSVMTRLLVDVLKQSIESEKQYVHMSYGRDRSKTRWSPREVVYMQYLVFRKSLRGRLSATLYTAISRLRASTHKGRKSPESSTSTVG